MNPVLLQYMVEGHLDELRRSAGRRTARPVRPRGLNRRHRMPVLRWGNAADAAQGC